jgi:hypothetical protein
MPDVGDASSRKRFIHGKLAHVGQALKRKGYQHIGLTVFEHGGPNGNDLHAHQLIVLPTGGERIIGAYIDDLIVDLRAIAPDERHKVADYISKQRRPLSPDFEADNGHRYETDVKPVPGKKLSFTKAATQALNGEIVSPLAALNKTLGDA